MELAGERSDVHRRTIGPAVEHRDADYSTCLSSGQISCFGSHQTIWNSCPSRMPCSRSEPFGSIVRRVIESNPSYWFDNRVLAALFLQSVMSYCVSRLLLLASATVIVSK